MTPIRTATGTAGTPITVGCEPIDIVITPNGRTAYVVNFYGDSVSAIDTATDKVSATTSAPSPGRSPSSRSGPRPALDAWPEEQLGADVLHKCALGSASYS